MFVNRTKINIFHLIYSNFLHFIFPIYFFRETNVRWIWQVSKRGHHHIHWRHFALNHMLGDRVQPCGQHRHQSGRQTATKRSADIACRHTEFIWEIHNRISEVIKCAFTLREGWESINYPRNFFHKHFHNKNSSPPWYSFDICFVHSRIIMIKSIYNKLFLSLFCTGTYRKMLRNRFFQLHPALLLRRTGDSREISKWGFFAAWLVYYFPNKISPGDIERLEQKCQKE